MAKKEASETSLEEKNETGQEEESKTTSKPETVTLTMDDLKKLIAQEVAKAKESEEPAVGKGTETAQEKKDREYYEELVEVRLFYDGNKYKDDVIVNVNGKAWQIKRGVTIKVPRFVKAVLDSSAEQDAATSKMVRDLTESFERKTTAIT